MDTNLDVVDRYGLPLVMLALIVLAAWRVWRFVRLVRETLEEHILLINGSVTRLRPTRLHSNTRPGRSAPTPKRSR